MDGVHGKPVTTDTRAAQDLGPILQRQIPNVVQVGTDNRVKLARYRADRPIRKPLISGWTARERHPTNIKSRLLVRHQQLQTMAVRIGEVDASRIVLGAVDFDAGGLQRLFHAWLL